ncbi:MAG: hypothetical protein M1824_006639 [Vezdaea acicularis]|nr:MAG: hypothetical protein M1824_006639 [Vezdaea acicularis]
MYLDSLLTSRASLRTALLLFSYLLPAVSSVSLNYPFAVNPHFHCYGDLPNDGYPAEYPQSTFASMTDLCSHNELANVGCICYNFAVECGFFTWNPQLIAAFKDLCELRCTCDYEKTWPLEIQTKDRDEPYKGRLPAESPQRNGAGISRQGSTSSDGSWVVVDGQSVQGTLARVDGPAHFRPAEQRRKRKWGSCDGKRVWRWQEGDDPVFPPPRCAADSGKMNTGWLALDMNFASGGRRR